jgi:type VI secretion system protein ImpC
MEMATADKASAQTAVKMATTLEESTEKSLVDEIAGITALKPNEEGYPELKQGLDALLREILKPERRGQRVSAALVDNMIANLDQRLGLQIDEILHHPEVKKLESAWRGLKLLVDRTDFRENIKLEILSVSKDELASDFEDTPEIVKSGLYKHVYTSEYGQFGGKPYGAMIANYEFGPNAPDIKLLQNVASVAAMAHAPFIAAAHPSFFGSSGSSDFLALPNLKDLSSIFGGAQYAKWRSFRDSEDARYVGLTCPRFLLREPYDEENNPVKAFNYNEDVSSSHQKYLWGNTAFAFATRLTDSFAKYRWTANIIGPKSGGTVENLPLHQFKSMGAIVNKIPTEVLIPGRREYELAEQGFITLEMRKDTDNAAFFSANSVKKPKFFGISREGKEAETNEKLGTQLPYMFIITRLAHYIKVLQKEHIGDWTERSDLERELNIWIKQYVVNQENPPQSVRSKRPLRDASVQVEDVEGDPGWYRVSLEVRPHFKYMGAYFTLSLVGKLDKEKIT